VIALSVNNYLSSISNYLSIVALLRCCVVSCTRREGGRPVGADPEESRASAREQPARLWQWMEALG
jgi:hypothetical protein